MVLTLSRQATNCLSDEQVRDNALSSSSSVAKRFLVKFVEATGARKN